MASVRNLNLNGHVGFDSLPDQLVNKSVAQGFCFNILCLGESFIMLYLISLILMYFNIGYCKMIAHDTRWNWQYFFYIVLQTLHMIYIFMLQVKQALGSPLWWTPSSTPILTPPPAHMIYQGWNSRPVLTVRQRIHFNDFLFKCELRWKCYEIEQSPLNLWLSFRATRKQC